MKIVKGNKIEELSLGAYEYLKKIYKMVAIDLGTGDGRFIYKNALTQPDTLWIGVDPAAKQMEEFSIKAVRKKLPNVLFVIGSVELFPTELKNSADTLFITLPWGSLLKTVALGNNTDIEKLKSLLKNSESEIEIVFGYDKSLEPSQTEKNRLDKLDEDTIKNIVVPKFEASGFTLKEYKMLNSSSLKTLDSTWGKRISQRKEREIYLVRFGQKITQV